MKAMLAKQYDDRNPEGWWMSEKLDGVRAIWDGTNLISRNGNRFNAPGWFTDNLPTDVVLDGELWEGRGLFQQTVGRVRTKQDPDWSGVKYMVFDIVSSGTFEKRLESLDKLNLPDHVKILPQVRCMDRRHLARFEDKISAFGAEGVMLRKSGSLYEQRRSSALLKVKRFESDEAVVTGYTDGRGRNSGVIGAILCRFRGKIIQVGTGLNDEIRKFPPIIGSVITISFFELTNKGVPRFPVYIGCRDYE